MILRSGEFKKEKRGKSAYKSRATRVEQASVSLFFLGETSYSETALTDMYKQAGISEIKGRTILNMLKGNMYSLSPMPARGIRRLESLEFQGPSR